MTGCTRSWPWSEWAPQIRGVTGATGPIAAGDRGVARGMDAMGREAKAAATAIEAVKGCRTIGKKDMKWNDAMPKMKVDPERYVSSCTFFMVV